LGSPNLRDALVQHGPFHLAHNFFVQLIRPDEAQANFRAVQDFRKGWLMFLGIPSNYRNDYDIANAVSTFGIARTLLSVVIWFILRFPLLLLCRGIWYLESMQLLVG
jgi:hypothetical protein